jgi:hypothetical protein
MELIPEVEDEEDIPKGSDLPSASPLPLGLPPHLAQPSLLSVRPRGSEWRGRGGVASEGAAPEVGGERGVDSGHVVGGRERGASGSGLGGGVGGREGRRGRGR